MDKESIKEIFLKIKSLYCIFNKKNGFINIIDLKILLC